MRHQADRLTATRWAVTVDTLLDKSIVSEIGHGSIRNSGRSDALKVPLFTVMMTSSLMSVAHAVVPAEYRYDLLCETTPVDAAPEIRRFHLDLRRGLAFDGDHEEPGKLLVSPKILIWMTTYEPAPGAEYQTNVSVDRTTGSGFIGQKLLASWSDGHLEAARLHCVKHEYSGPGGNIKF